MSRWISTYLNKQVHIAPLVNFRIIFGLMMLYSAVRFVLKGWVYDQYILPRYYFTFYGFDWIHPLGGNGMYWVFGLLILSSLFIVFGMFYRLSIITYFLSFTYVELIDKTYYLNHYYFISLASFILIFLPANKSFSLDVKLGLTKTVEKIPAWTIDLIKFQLGLVYFFAGVAKLNPDWLFHAQPLINWLKHQTELPLIGGLMKYDLTAYLFSWGGALFDLSIPFILWTKKFRIWGYLAVVFFHTITGIMFPIGVFPLVMMASTLIFFSENFHLKILNQLKNWFHVTEKPSQFQNKIKGLPYFFMVFAFFQLILPFRYTLYPGKLFWNEEGFRFSWRVMLIEKAGFTEFSVHNPNGNEKIFINNSDYLTPRQEKMMATQADMILQYAHHLRDIYTDTLIQERKHQFYIDTPVVKVNSKVSLFNQGSRPFIDPNIDLAKQKRGWKHKEWILPYEK